MICYAVLCCWALVASAACRTMQSCNTPTGDKSSISCGSYDIIKFICCAMLCYALIMLVLVRACASAACCTLLLHGGQPARLATGCHRLGGSSSISYDIIKLLYVSMSRRHGIELTQLHHLVRGKCEP